MHDVGIVILNYNTRDLLRRCFSNGFGKRRHQLSRDGRGQLHHQTAAPDGAYRISSGRG